MTRRGADATLARYLRDIAGFPLLDPEEERALARRSRDGDAAARRRLVECNLRFVASYAWRYRGAAESLLDLIHEGNLGLLAAARRFDPERETRFLSYAVLFIREAILRALARQTPGISLPARPGRALIRLKAARARLTRELSHAPSIEELSLAAGIAPEETARLVAHLQEPAPAEAAVAAESVEDAVLKESQVEAVIRSLARLSPRERLVLTERFGLAGREPRRLSEIAARLRLSAERVRQIEAAALQKLRRFFPGGGPRGPEREPPGAKSRVVPLRRPAR